MKVVVTKFLNVRVGAPSVNAPCFQYLAPGSEIEVDGKLYKGDEYDKINTWLKDQAGNYYWSGGVEHSIAGDINYKKSILYLDRNWTGTDGDGVSVVIIDGGAACNTNYSTIKKENCVNISNGPDTNHTTFIGGIISGIKNVHGISTKSNIISINYKRDNNSIKELLDNLFHALDYASHINGPAVINLSQGFYPFSLSNYNAEKNQIISSIQNITGQKNKFVICSAGDNNILTNNFLFPASLIECISIGSIGDYYKNIAISNQLNILTPQTEFKSYNTDFNLMTDAGSSYATAMIAAIVSLIIAADPNKTHTKTSILADLKTYSTNKNQFIFNSNDTFQYYT